MDGKIYALATPGKDAWGCDSQGATTGAKIQIKTIIRTLA